MHNTAYPAYPAAYLLHSLNDTRVVTFGASKQTEYIVALSAVSKPGSVQSGAVGSNVYSNLYYPSIADHMDNAGWVFSVHNAIDSLSYVKLVAQTNNASATNNLHDQSLTSSGNMRHVTRGINGAFSRLSCHNTTQH